MYLTKRNRQVEGKVVMLDPHERYMQISVLLFHSLSIKLLIIYVYSGVGLNNVEDSSGSGGIYV
jgi:hypothetical protein